MITLKIKIRMDMVEEEARVEVVGKIEGDVVITEGVGDMIEILLKTLVIITLILNFKTLIKAKMVKINMLRESKSQKNLMKCMSKIKFKSL